ncbi:cation:proton antiporter [Galbitalea soli]|uniref:Sodium:proton antiporter n=1 Tax=Galbitalea soli TaxID=1268042 RepID=A0A7C9TRB3_9MICO|nr:sodium:proton antiporter [Galbitalea soli]NEM91579.1 sodium:proton antiporter [Galbitalea soli]NYJ30273.1 CPA1 family monovalent cation:H+ antiporter [Galbitalea soli]
MEFALFGVIAVVTIVAATAFSSKLGVAAPLLLVLVGIGYSFIPGVPVIPVQPQWILMGVLPPLLYAAAISVPVVDFRRNFNTISALSVLLVIVSALVTGFVIFMILPDLDLASAIAVGAVISPTDVVAATAIGKRIGLPPRLMAILEGEGLVNDATALVLLRTAIAAGALSLTNGSFQLWPAIGSFFYSALVAAVIGLAIGWITVRIRAMLKDPMLDTAISFAVAFIAYIPAEEVHASGVIAVVVAGLYSGHNSAKRFSPQVRISERLNWRTVQFILENGVFLLMGAQLSGIVAEVGESKEPINAIESVLIGMLAAVILIVLRFAFVGPLLVVIRRRGDRDEQQHQRFAERLDAFIHLGTGDQRQRRRQERVQRLFDRRSNDISQLRAEGLGWRGGVVLSWAGMRGVVTLAAAQTLPNDGTIPYRPQLILIAFTVAIVTLLLQGGTLPWVIRVTRIKGADEQEDRENLATLLESIAEAGLAALDNPELTTTEGEAFDRNAVDRVRHDTLLSAEATWERARTGEEMTRSPHQQYRALRREVIRAERDALLEARSRGDYPSRVLGRAQSFLDLEETRLQQIEDEG